MMRGRQTALGLVSAVALLVLALHVGTAYATYDQELTVKPVNLEGSQVTLNVFTTVSGTVKCEVATFSGNPTGAHVEPVPGTETYAEITVHPIYERCKAFGLAASVSTEGCNYVFTTATTTERAVTGYDAHATVHIECETGHAIVINAGAGGCIVKVTEQTPGGVVDFKNEANGTVLAGATVEVIEYHQEGAKCTGGAGTFAGGTYTGTVSVGGKDPTTGLPVKIKVT